MTTIDLSQFKQSYVKDTADDLQEIAAMKQISRIPEGSHEVVVTDLFTKKDGSQFYVSDTLGGVLGFSLNVANAQKAEQIVYFAIPLAVTFKQACLDTDKKISFQFKNTVKNLQAIGIDVAALRESIIETNGKAAEELVGAQFILTNSWPMKKLHLEYDSGAKAFFYATSMGERFTEGELSVPIALDYNKDIKDRYSEAVAIAHENNYELATQMNVAIECNPSIDNEAINVKLRAIGQPKKKVAPPPFSIPKVVNKTAPPFPGLVPKKVSAPIEVIEDIDL